MYRKDELLTNVMIYWVSNCITSSMRLYYETKKSGRWGPVDQYVPVPTGSIQFLLTSNKAVCVPHSLIYTCIIYYRLCDIQA